VGVTDKHGKTGQIMTDRGQTVHDYLLGVVIVILTVGTAIGVLGLAYDPFFDPVDNEDQNLANNIGEEILEAGTSAQGEKTISIDAINESLQDASDDEFGTQWRQWNITIETLDGEIITSAGDSPEGEADARSVRIINSVEQTSDCADGCQLIVRIW